jgi:hypothetical protein
MDRIVTVWGRPQTVRISQSSRTSWSATGEYRGDILYGHGPSASAALAKWAAVAKSKGQLRA